MSKEEQILASYPNGLSWSVIKMPIFQTPRGQLMSSDDGVIVTENEPRPARPDNTSEQAAAEDRAGQVVKDLDAGLVSRRGAINVKHAAKRAIGGHDLGRGLKNLP